jgi:hypothetical protein
MARRLRTRTRSVKGSVSGESATSAVRNAVTLLGASLDLSGKATRSVVSGRYISSSRAKRGDWQAIGGDFDRAISRAGSRRADT